MMLERRTFLTEMDQQQDGFFIANQDFPVIPGDSSDGFRTQQEIRKRTPLSKQEKTKSWETNSLKMELVAKERELKEQYPNGYKLYKSYDSAFSNDSQRLYYLSLQPQEQKEFLYLLGSKGIKQRDSARAPASVESSTPFLTQGMSKADVLKTWGKPNSIGIAGLSKFENERWSYYKEGKINYIYFEGGVVQGWELP
jgi:hypothetical protein